MDNNNYIDEVVNLYFKGYSVEQALRVTKNERKQDELKKIAETWESKASKSPITESRGLKFQQAKFI